MMDLNVLSMIILNYNSYDDTVFCVNRLLSFDMNLHIIIVDNMSLDGSYQRLVERFQSETRTDVLRTERNGGYSYGNNYGIRFALERYHSKYVGILNPDVILNDRSVIDSMITALETIDKLAVAGASAINADGIYNPAFSGWNIPTGRNVVLNHFIINSRKSKTINMKMLSGHVGQIECVAGCFFIANSSILSDLGFLDENVFLYNEENILGIKCKQNGYMEGVVLDQFYIHNHRHNPSKYVSFKEKVNLTSVGYQSRKYLCKTYYSRVYLPFLFLAELCNKIYLSVAYVKSAISRISRQK